MSTVVYWLDHSTGTPECNYRMFEGQIISAPLDFCTGLRKREDVSHVDMCTDNPDMVGKLGVSAVEGGKTPDGFDYEWSKAHRAGRIKRGESIKTTVNKNGN